MNRDTPPAASWRHLSAVTSDFEPENDGDLLDWMTDEVTGMAAYAEALVEQYENCLKLGLDPVAMNALHDVADASATAAEAMAAARRTFADHYEQPREFAGQGGLMPHGGRWITGGSPAASRPLAVDEHPAAGLEVELVQVIGTASGPLKRATPVAAVTGNSRSAWGELDVIRCGTGELLGRIRPEWGGTPVRPGWGAWRHDDYDGIEPRGWHPGLAGAVQAILGRPSPGAHYRLKGADRDGIRGGDRG